MISEHGSKGRRTAVIALLLGGCGGSGSNPGAADAGSTSDGSGSTVTTSSSSGTAPGSTGAGSPSSTSGSNDGGSTTTTSAATTTSTGTSGGATAGCDPADPTLTDDEHTLLELPADSWWQAPNTPIRPLCPTDRTGCTNVVAAWSGGAFDPVHGRMLIFGGGHADYSGNEVYGFDIASLTWSRLTDPSSPDLQDADPLPDGQPVSRHSYDGIQYLSHADVMLAHGGARWHDGHGTGVTWELDGTDLAWTNRQPPNGSGGNGYSQASAYDPSTGITYFHVTSVLAAYDHDANDWQVLQDLGYPPLWPRYQVWGDKVGAFDTSRGLAWFFGAGLYMVYDPAMDAVVTDDWIATGGSTFDNTDAVGSHTEQIIMTGGAEVIEATAPGVDYDVSADALVAWVGGGPWSLDLATKAWTQGSSDGAPTDTAPHGTFGRWRYIERTNVFVLVNGVDDDVWFYKHTAGCGG